MSHDCKSHFLLSRDNMWSHVEDRPYFYNCATLLPFIRHLSINRRRMMAIMVANGILWIDDKFAKLTQCRARIVPSRCDNEPPINMKPNALECSSLISLILDLNFHRGSNVLFVTSSALREKKVKSPCSCNQTFNFPNVLACGPD